MFAILALLAKIIIIVFIGIFCDPHPAVIALFCVGIVVYSINEIALKDHYSIAPRVVLHIIGSLLMIVPIIVMTAPYFSMDDDELNYMKVTALGLVSVFLLANWFNIGELDAGIDLEYLYLIAGGLLLLNGFVYMFSLSLHTMLIINLILSIIAAIANVIMRFVMGSAFE